MGKGKFSTGNDYKSNGDDNLKEDTIVIAPAKKTGAMVSLSFRYNRPFDLHIGRYLYRFEPHQKREDIPSKVLDHIDFQNVKKYFVINGV